MCSHIDSTSARRFRQSGNRGAAGIEQVAVTRRFQALEEGVGFWEEVTEGALASNFQKTALSGVGNRVDWAWAQVIEWVRSE